MNQYDRDKGELGRRVALDLSDENAWSGNFAAQSVAGRAAYARHRAEQDRIYGTDYGLDDD
jgi:hypothetical protein